MVKNPFEKVSTRVREYLDERNPHRVMRRIRREYKDHEWSPKIDALLGSEEIDGSDKFYILLRTKPLKLEHLIPFILKKKGYTGVDDRTIADHLIERISEVEWSPVLTKIFFRNDVARDLKSRLLISKKIKTPIPFDLNREIFHRSDMDVLLKSILAEKTVGATWDDCERIEPEKVKQLLYFSSSHYDLLPHRFLENINHAASQKGLRDKSYVEALSLIVRPSFDTITKELEGAGKLKSYTPHQISTEGHRLMSKAQKEMTREERESLESLGIDVNRNVLQLYLRYTNGINYGPIADALQLCTAWFFERQYSRYFNGIRILPSRNKTLPPNTLIPRTKAEVASVSGPEFVALNKLPTIYFSHSTFGGKTPGITSAATKGDERCVRSRIELEEFYGGNEFAKNATIEEIVREYLDNLIELEKKLDIFLQ